MAKQHMKNAGVVGLVGEQRGEVVLRLYSTERRALVAVVVGSVRYVRRALVAAGLATPAVRLAEDGDGGRLLGKRALVGSEPTNRDAELAREPDDGGGLHPSGTFPTLKAGDLPRVHIRSSGERGSS